MKPGQATELKRVIAFLLGDGKLGGTWFGEMKANRSGNYWWRKELRAAAACLDSLTEQGDETTHAQPEKAFDGSDYLGRYASAEEVAVSVVDAAQAQQTPPAQPEPPDFAKGAPHEFRHTLGLPNCCFECGLSAENCARVQALAAQPPQPAQPVAEHGLATNPVVEREPPNVSDKAAPAQPAGEPEEEDWGAPGPARTVTLSPAEVLALHTIGGWQHASSYLIRTYKGDRTKDGRDSIDGWVDEFFGAVQVVARLGDRLDALSVEPPAPAAVECGNCIDGKSDMDHPCRKCDGTGLIRPQATEGGEAAIAVPSVPSNVIQAISAYGDARSDGIDSGAKLGRAIAAIRAAIAQHQSPVAVPSDVERLREHFEEIEATLRGSHTIMENLSANERRIGPLGSHGRGYTWKITNALKHLTELRAALAQQQAVQQPPELTTGAAAKPPELAGIPPEQSEDTELLDALVKESWGLVPFDVPTGAGDGDIGWRVIGYYGSTPVERVEAEVFEDDPRAALRAARAQEQRRGPNSGHGHVFPRLDGFKARCGGPGFCKVCTADAVLAQEAKK